MINLVAMVISVLFLISVFVNSAIYLMFTGINFIGISYIIVYVGAIAILFLFILMMINKSRTYHSNRIILYFIDYACLKI